MIRLLSGIAIAFFLVMPFAVVTVTSFLEARRPLVQVEDFALFDVRDVPRDGLVHATLHAEHTHLLGRYQFGSGAVVSVDHSNAVVSLDTADYDALQRDGRLDLLGTVALASTRNTPGLKRDGPILVRMHGGPVPWTVPAGCAAATFVAAIASALLINSWRWRRAAGRGDVTVGWFERIGQQYPGLVELVERISINGIGLRWIDFHDPHDDGSIQATQWFTVNFLPCGPVRRARIRILSESEQGVPGVVRIRTMRYAVLARSAVDQSRNGRVYAFYYGVLLPLVVLPFAGGFALMLAHDFKFEAWVFWVGLAAAMAPGIAAVALERRLMGPPRGSTPSPEPTT